MNNAHNLGEDSGEGWEEDLFQSSENNEFRYEDVDTGAVVDTAAEHYHTHEGTDSDEVEGLGYLDGNPQAQKLFAIVAIICVTIFLIGFVFFVT